LKANGTVVAIGENEKGQCNTGRWRDIIAVSAGDDTVGLKADGTVVEVREIGYRLYYNWRDIIGVSTAFFNTVGLKADGTVVTVGHNTDSQCNTSGWRDIVAVAAGDRHTIGLKADGTVVAVGDNKYGQCNTDRWCNIGPFD
jgi:alpha-tubulin suppressor-like RCC1 family protein